MSESGPYFYAWCNDAERVAAFAAALSSIVIPGDLIIVSMSSEKVYRTHSTDEAIKIICSHFHETTSASALSGVMLRSRRAICFGSACYTEESERHRPSGPINLSPSDKSDFLPFRINLALGRGPRSVGVEAAVAWHLVQPDLEDLLLRLCAPDTSRRVPTGGCTNLWDWGAPIEICGTYNSDASEIARDLALSWIHLYDKDKVERAAGMSLDVLHARVEAAPRGARVAVKGAGQLSLSRETVLKALAMPVETLLSALEAAAVPDDAWRAVEPRAREIMEATSQIKEDYDGLQVWEIDFTTRKHVRFLEEHAPFRVRRLPSGGVVLATHPYRTLWPLWADALFVLGLM